MENIKYDNEASLKFLNKPENEGFARATVAAFVSQLDPTLSDIADIKTAVSEAVTNAVIYAYEKEDYIYVHCGIKNNQVYITVKDNGKGIKDIEKAKEPLFTSKPELERSGMGFTVMENFMDDVKIDSIVGEGTTVYMNKVIK